MDGDWRYPWLRLTLLIRVFLTRRWDAEVWPVIKGELRKALALRAAVARRGWFN